MPGYDLHPEGRGREAQREQASADCRIDNERQEPGHRARVVALRAHAGCLWVGAHDCALASGTWASGGSASGDSEELCAPASGGWLSAGWPSGKADGIDGAGILRRSARCTHRSMKPSSPTAWLRAASSASIAIPPDELAMME